MTSEQPQQPEHPIDYLFRRREEQRRTGQDGAEPERLEDMLFRRRDEKRAQRHQNAHDSLYGLAALDDECAKLSTVTQGERDDSINAAAYAMGQLVGGGELTVETARARLFDAARATGQPDWEIDRALRLDSTGGLIAGQQQPRSAPERVTYERAPVPLARVERLRDPSDIDPLDVDRFAYELRVREEARRKVARLNGLNSAPTDVVPLRDFLAVDDPETTYRIDKLWPLGGRVVLAAPNKAGKSTLVGNLLRCLADGDALLDQYATQPARVVLIDNELDERTLRRWLRDHAVNNVDRVSLLPLRGNVSSFDLLDVQTRHEWAQRITGADVVILDCLRPVLDALALSEDKDAGRFLVAFDALLRDAHASEALVVHHMGHAGERARGDSRLLDWPDATWKIVKDDQADGALACDVARYFTAYGRDVDVAQRQLGYEPETRRLTIAGGSRHDMRVIAALGAVLNLLIASGDELSGRQITDALDGSGHKRDDVRNAIRQGVAQGQIERRKGDKRAWLHSIPH